MSEAAIEDAVAEWQRRDRERTAAAVDERAIAQSEAARALVVRSHLEGAHTAELLGAWLRLGRLSSELGASPTLLSGLVETLPRPLDPATAAGARAAVLEGALRATSEELRAAGRRAWDYPGCVVPIDGASAAVVGPPDAVWDEDDALARWAGRVASGLARRGVREVLVTAGPRALAELDDALETVGARRVPPAPAGPRGSADR